MKVTFIYDKGKDILCLLNKGKSTNNQQSSTKQYELLVAKYGDNINVENTSTFIDGYISENEIDIQRKVDDFQKEWDSVSFEFQKRAELIFGVVLPHDVTAYLTINSRRPYSIEENYLYASVHSTQARATTMHELWHFYTWYGLGVDQEEKLGIQKYNDLKETLTVLLNVECSDLVPEGVVDVGYPQHQEIRKRVLEFWEKKRNIKGLWNYLVEQM